ncbi:MAG: threonine ammonia-lyase [Jiangellaceae bacterium]
MNPTPPSITDVLQARRLLAAHLPETPMWSYPVLDAALGARVHVKHDNVQPTGAFKVRGGITLLAAMAPGERERGLVAYSTGNHAQSIAYACRLYDVPCVVVMPENPNPSKVAAVEALGADVTIAGATMVEASAQAATIATERDMRLVSPAEPDLIAGVATLYLELFDREPDLEAVFVPVGGGSGAAAACIVAAAVSPDCRIIGVQSAQAPAAHDSWRLGELVTRPVKTVVAGLATGSAFALTQQVMRGGLADFVLVDDADIDAAQRMLLTTAHTLAEGAGAAALAGLLSRQAEFAGRKVAIVCTGGNAGQAELDRVLAA